MHAGGETLPICGEDSLVLDLGSGLVVKHVFLVADLAVGSHLLGMDFLAQYGA